MKKQILKRLNELLDREEDRLFIYRKHNSGEEIQDGIIQGVELAISEIEGIKEEE